MTQIQILQHRHALQTHYALNEVIAKVKDPQTLHIFEAIKPPKKVMRDIELCKVLQTDQIFYFLDAVVTDIDLRDLFFAYNGYIILGIYPP